MIILATLAIIVFAGLVVRSLEWAVVVMLFLLPSYIWRFSLLGFPSTFLEVMLVLIIGGWGIQWARRKRSWPRMALRPLLLPLLGFLIAVGISMAVTPNLPDALGQLKAYIIEPLLFFVIFTDVTKETVWKRRAVLALLVSGGVIALLAVLQYATGVGIPDPWLAFPGRRAVSVYPYPNAVGLYLAPLLALGLGCAMFPSSAFAPARRLSIGVSVVMMLALFAAVVEGAVIGVFAGALFLVFFTAWRWRMIGLGVVLLMVLFVAPFSRDYLLPLLTFQDVSGDVRFALWQGALKLLADRPWLGSGLAGFQTFYDQYRLAKHTELLLYPHNIFLNFWVELGLLGLLSMGGMLLQFFRTGWRQARTFASDRGCLIVMGMMVTTVVYGMVEVPFFKNDLAILWWVMFGLMFAAQTKTTRANTAGVVE